MCVLQPISYSLLVALRYRPLPLPNRKGLARQITEPASASGGRAAPPDPRQTAGSVPIVAGLPVARSACTYPRHGSGSVFWLPVLLPNSRKGIGIRPRNGVATARANMKI
jgi:hypothetical protein